MECTAEQTDTGRMVCETSAGCSLVSSVPACLFIKVNHTVVWLYLYRVYLDGDYQEPSTYMLPPPPMVEEINDCKCLVM